MADIPPAKADDGSDALLREAADKMSLMEVVAKYCRAIDRRDYDLLREVYHPDAIDDHGGFFKGGIDDLIRSCRENLGIYSQTTHAISNGVFVVDGDMAEGETYVLSTHILQADPSKPVVIAARYLDRFERREGTWRIIYRTYVSDWSNLDEDHDPQGAKGRTDREDLSYRALPLLAALAG